MKHIRSPWRTCHKGKLLEHERRTCAARLFKGGLAGAVMVAVCGDVRKLFFAQSHKDHKAAMLAAAPLADSNSQAGDKG